MRPTPPLVSLLLAAVLVALPTPAHAEEDKLKNDIRFRTGHFDDSYECVALFEVLEAKLEAQTSRTSTYAVVLSVKDCLQWKPADQPIRLTVKKAGPLAHRGGPTDWFPHVTGARFVAAFNSQELNDVSTWRHLDRSYFNENKWRCLDKGHSEKIWHECVVFYKAVSHKAEQRAAALAKAI